MYKKIIMKNLVIYISPLLILAGCAVVRPGEVGIKQTLGKLSKNVKTQGSIVYNPFVSKVLIASIRTNNLELSLSLPSKEGLITNWYKSEMIDVKILDFPWMISDNITTSKGIYTNNRSYGFFHTVVDDYNIEVGLPKLRPIIRYLVNKVFAVTNTNKLLRARLDMVTYTGKNEYIHNPHTDFKGELIKNKSIDSI